jgi:predicted Zn-dependent protease
MDDAFVVRLSKRCLNRRDFLWLLSLSTAGFALVGCAIDPVTGKKQLVLMSEGEEIAIDTKQSPQQFSMDYGPCQDKALNAYLSEVGMLIAANSHRPKMPYSFRGVNAAYVNAYAFPGGSIAATRGILAELDNEAELAALLGHEIGHVNARHTAERMTKGTLIQIALAGSSGYVRRGEYASYAPYLEKIGGLGVGALLASYSRDDEREADRLGMQYMVGAGYNPRGMEGLMTLLVQKSQHKPNALELMFSTHPMSQDRLKAARQRAAGEYGDKLSKTLRRERYMDNTVSVRRIKPALLDMQDGASHMANQKFSEAEVSFASALNKVSNDYAALLMMAKCKMALKKDQEALRYATMARKVYPSEAQALQVSGVSKLALKDFGGAYGDFASFDQIMPGNSQMFFLKGITLDGMGEKEKAAREYNRYLQQVGQGDAASHARQRLTDWGYVK